MPLVQTHQTNWSARDAVLYLRGQVHDPTDNWFEYCLGLCARAYGFAGSGTQNVTAGPKVEAIDYWATAKEEFKHPDDANPPVGALACWRHGDTSGHIAVVVRSNGDGVKIASNDIVTDGDVDIVDLGRIHEKWQHTYLGWVEPHFPNGSGVNPDPKPQEEHAISLADVKHAAETGGHGAGVARVQEALMDEYHAFHVGAERGTYGHKTKEFYTKWQHDQPEHFTGADANGIPGALTLTRLGARQGFNVAD